MSNLRVRGSKPADTAEPAVVEEDGVIVERNEDVAREENAETIRNAEQVAEQRGQTSEAAALEQQHERNANWASGGVYSLDASGKRVRVDEQTGEPWQDPNKVEEPVGAETVIPGTDAE